MAQEQITNPPIHAIILAAGLSTRMGGYPKALLPVHGSKTMLELAVYAFLDAGISSLFVVTGHKQDDVSTLAKSLNAQPIFNPDYHNGMLSSVHAGIAALPSCRTPPSAFFLLPVDAPFVHAHTLQKLVKVWHDGTASDTNALILPTFHQQTGHPPLIANGHWQRILDWQGTNGLRGYFASLLPAEDATAFLAGNIPEQQTHPLATAYEPHSIHFHPVADAGILGDIDTPEELAKVVQAFAAPCHVLKIG